MYRSLLATDDHGDDGTATDDHGDDHPSEVHFRDFGIGMFVLALTMGIIARSSSAGAKLVDKSTVMGRYSVSILAIFTRFPYTVMVMLMGLIIGFMHELNSGIFGETLGESLGHWSSVSPEVVLFTILPILLFESAFSADVHIFRHEAKQIFVLAGPGVILSTLLTATFAIYVFGYDWDWYVALMFGSMMSATDPVAVVALVKELGMNERIGTLIEGEGLMNDGSAIVLFNVFKSAITSKDNLTAGGVVATAFRLSCGGPVVGIAIGAVTSMFLAHFTYNDLQSEVTLTVVCCYSCFLVAEGTDLHVSGVLAVVFAGLYLSFYGRGNISVKVEHSLHAFWHMAEYIADTLIFFVAGVVMANKLMSEAIDSRDWGNLFMLFAALQVVRALNVILCWPVLKQGYGVSWQEGVVLVAGGLRGAVGLCLGLVVEEIDDAFIPSEYKSKIMFHMSGVAFLSLIINGTFMNKLVAYLGLDRISKAESEMFDHSCIIIEKRMEKYVESELKTDMFLCNADYGIVWRYIPVMSAQQYWDRISTRRVVLGLKEKEIMKSIVPESKRTRSFRSLASSGSSGKKRSKGEDEIIAIDDQMFDDYADSSDDSDNEEGETDMLQKLLHRVCRGAKAGIEAVSDINSGYEHIPLRLQRHWHKLHWQYFGHGHHDRSTILRDGTGRLTSNVDTSAPARLNKSKSFAAKVVRKQSFHNPALSKQKSMFQSDGVGLQGKMAQREQLAELLEKMDEDISATIELAKQKQADQRRMSFVEPKLNDDSMEKARTRFMQAVRAQYQSNHHLGRMRPSVLRTLRESADGQLDNPHEPLHDFESLESRLTMSPNLQKLARTFADVPVVEEILKHWIYLHLAFSIELACEFVRAHQAVDIIDLLGEGAIAEKLIAENNGQLAKVHDVLNSQLPVFPEITHALKTQTATRQLLMFHMREIDVLVEEGSITEKEYESMLHKTDEMLIKLHSHPLAERLPQMADMLVSSNFMRGVALEEVERLATSGHMFTEMFVEPNVKLFKKGEKGVIGGPASGRSGWFLLARGLVKMSGEGDETDSITGKKPTDILSLRPAKSGDVKGQRETADVIVRPGATFGLFEQILGCPFDYDFETISYCHVLFVDAACILKEAAKPSGQDIFLGLFKAMALPLIPGLLKLDNNRKDPMRLVTSRDRYNGWESTGYMVHASSTEAEATLKRKACSSARRNDYRFLGLKSLDKATFLRPHMEELAVQQAPVSLMGAGGAPRTSVVTSASKHPLAPNGSMSDFSDLLDNRKRSVSAARWPVHNLSSNLDGAPPAKFTSQNSISEDINGGPGELSKRPSFFLRQSTFALAHAHTQNQSASEDNGNVTVTVANTPLKKDKVDTQPGIQWVIDVSKQKRYLLLRGSILGRAAHSKETATAASMIDEVKNLAQRAGENSHISDAELLVLHALLQKLQRAPISSHSNQTQTTIRTSTPPASPRKSRNYENSPRKNVPDKLKGFPHSPHPLTLTETDEQLKAKTSLSKENDSESDDWEPTDAPPAIVASSIPPPPPLSFMRNNSDASVNRDSLNSMDRSINSPVHELHRIASELENPDTEDQNDIDEAVPEMEAPCVLPKHVNGRLEVTARSVIMEVPHYFKAASAALKMLTKLRKQQRSMEYPLEEEEESEDEEEGMTDLVMNLLANMRAGKGTFSLEKDVSTKGGSSGGGEVVEAGPVLQLSKKKKKKSASENNELMNIFM